MDVVIAQLPRFLSAIWTTIWLFAVVSLLSTLIGGAIALVAQRLGRVAAWPVAIYCWIFRSLPELVVLFACYMALPQLGLRLGSVQAAILAFTLVGVAFQIEIFRAGLAAIDHRQYDAIRALGIPWLPATRRIVLPQVVRAVIAPWATYAAGSIKAMSLASAIAVTEIMFVTRQTMSISQQPFVLILLVAAVYCAIVSCLLVAEQLVHRRYARKFGMHRHTA